MNKGGLSIQTLLISALAAVAAAVIVPLFWEKGTLVATAMTPVIVALVSEALRRPAEVIKTAAPRVSRRSATGAAVRMPPEEVEEFEPLPADQRVDEPATARSGDPFGLRRRRRPVRHHWRLALATGAAAFVIAVVGLTMSELVLGGAATRDDGRTTFFPGRTQEREEEEEPTPTPSPSPTATPTATETPEPTATPTATETAVPAPTATPPPAASPPAATPTPTP